MSRRSCTFLILAAGLLCPCVLRGDSPYLYGIHFWGLTHGQPADSGPCQILDCPAYGGWTTEVVLTHGDPWWSASWFLAGFQDLYQNKNVTIITRIDYKWGETVPAPGNPDHAGWADAVLAVVNLLSPYCHLWVIGNEPNLTLEGNNWPNNRVTPAGYASIYRAVRNRIHQSALPSPAGPHRVLLAAVSPGPAGGVRWMAGTDWLSQTIDNIPAAELDGFAIHSYGGTVTDFRNGYSAQLQVITNKGLGTRPVYMTEFNRAATPGNAAEEAAAAQFLRDAFLDVRNWNATPGKLNIVAMTWFVYDDSPEWRPYSIEYWRDNGNPPGHSGDLWTAFQQTVDLRYPAGAIGTPGLNPPVANFTAAPEWGEAPLAVQFTDTSTNLIDTRQWTFGDGGTSTATNPLYTYQTPGVYTVSLTVTGPGGTDTRTRPNLIRVIPAEKCEEQRIASFEEYAVGTQVMFRPPRFSATTSGNLAGSPNVSAVADEVLGADGGRALKIQWAFVDTSTARWLRLTTSGAPALPNPTIDLRRPLRFRLRCDSGSFRLALGVRETGVNVPIGADGGTTGTIEWVGASSVVGGVPQGMLVSAQPGVWQTIVFYPRVDPVRAFTGDGVLSAAHDRGVLEHLAITSTGTAGPFTVYLDGFEQPCYTRYDADQDGDVDMDDFAWFQRCLSGSNLPQTDPACQNARLDNDSDVDYLDLTIFRGCMSGAGVPVALSCME